MYKLSVKMQIILFEYGIIIECILNRKVFKMVLNNKITLKYCFLYKVISESILMFICLDVNINFNGIN